MGKFIQSIVYTKNNNVLWVADPVAKAVYMINGSDGSIKDTITPTFGPPQWLAYDWVTQLDLDSVLRIISLSSINAANGSQPTRA